MTAVLSTGYLGSYTNTSGGLFLMINDQFQSFNGDRSNVENVAVVITDGYGNVDTNLLQPYSDQAEVEITLKLLFTVLEYRT